MRTAVHPMVSVPSGSREWSRSLVMLSRQIGVTGRSLRWVVGVVIRQRGERDHMRVQVPIETTGIRRRLMCRTATMSNPHQVPHVCICLSINGTALRRAC